MRAIDKNVIVAVAFLAAIAAPMAITVTGVRLYVSFRENRVPARFPRAELRHGQLTKFISGFDQYVDDNFGFRSYLITAIGAAKRLIGVASNPVVVMGKGGYLFTAGQPDPDNPRGGRQLDLDDYRGIAAPHPELMANWRTALLERRQWLADMGTRFLLVIPPQKETIYPEQLPTWLQRQGDHTQSGHLLQYLSGSDLDVLFPKEEMQAAKTLGQLYYKQDTHWTFLGAFVGAQAILTHLAKSFPTITVQEVDQFEKTAIGTRQNESKMMDLCLQLGIMSCEEKDYLMVPKHGWTAKRIEFGKKGAIYEKDDNSLPTLVVYGDSYTWAMEWYLAEHFRRAVFFNPWVISAEPEAQFPVEPAESERPDILIYNRMERGLWIPTGNPEAIRKHAGTPQ